MKKEWKEPRLRYPTPARRDETDILYGTRGDPNNSRIMIVGESWGIEEKRMQMPFMGKSGMVLEILLHEANIDRHECFFTNVVSYRPSGNNMETLFHFTNFAKKNRSQQVRGLFPRQIVRDGLERLQKQIELVKPELIIGLGNYTLWALTDDDFKIKADKGRYVPTGIGDYRGSQLRTRVGGVPFLPTYHPAATFRSYPWRAMIRHDFKMRVSKVANWDGLTQIFYVVRPDCTTTMGWLNECIFIAEGDGEIDIAVDIETRNGFIACLGVTYGIERGLCIPFLTTDKGKKAGYWSPEEEQIIVLKLRELFTHLNVTVIGHNFSFDAQYIFNQLFINIPNFDDTMVMHHCLYPGGGDPESAQRMAPQGLVQKSLNHVSSLYNFHHKYWKSEGKEWDTSMPEEQLWIYNCRDCCATLEAYHNLKRELTTANLWPQYQFQKQQLNELALPMMLRGFKIDTKSRSSMQLELLDAIAEYETKIYPMVPQELLPPVKKGQAPWY